MRALSFSLSTVALTLLTVAPGSWDERPRDHRPRDDTARGVRLPGTVEPVERTTFLGPTAFLDALGGPTSLGLEALAATAQRGDSIGREFYFSRAIYSSFRRGFRRGGGGSWSTDYPKADQIFLSFIDRLLSNIDAYEWQHAIRLDDPELRRFPFLYALEVGAMALTPPEILGLKDYLLAGGFLVIDDFWGSLQWANFEYEIQQVLPGYEIVDLDLDHEIFTTFYEIDEILQVPNRNNGVRGGPTHQQDGYVPWVKGIHDENGRLMVVINWNTDLGDAWEWADDPYYPFRYSSYAYEMGVNFIVYAMSH